MIISYANTTPALLALAKNVTRRAWTERHAAKFRKGMLCQAYDKNPRIGGRQVATVRLTADPYRESTRKLKAQDYIDEGFDWLRSHGLTVAGADPTLFYMRWKAEDNRLWVVRFEVVEILEPLKAYLERVKL